MTKLWPIFILLTLGLAQANEEMASSISFGPVVIGENRIPLLLSDFHLELNIPKSLRPKVQFVPESVQWVRVDKILLTPRAQLQLSLNISARDVSLRYLDRSILFQSDQEKAFAQFYVSLFNPGKIELFIKGKKAGNIQIIPLPQKDERERHLIDYSCAPFNLQVEGLQGEYFSAGCQLLRQGKWGNESGGLEIHWVSANYRLLDESDPPYLATMIDERPVEFSLKNHQGKKRNIKLSAAIPKKLPRLKTALGFGPYGFETQQDGYPRRQNWTSPLMLYMNLTLKPNSSLRAFESYIWNGSSFNNLGLYFAYSVGSAFDNRLEVIPLLGLQHISFKHFEGGPSFSQIIYPQGAEFVYKHAFGLKNYSLVYGMFLSPKSEENYKNLWLRFGKKIFVEVNYISWSNAERKARMRGLSVGVPFASFF